MKALNTLGYQQLTVAATAASLTVPAGAKRAVAVVSGANIRVRYDGTAPTSTVGFPVDSGDIIEFLGANYRTELVNAQFIRTGAVSATLDINYYD